MRASKSSWRTKATRGAAVQPDVITLSSLALGSPLASLDSDDSSNDLAEEAPTRSEGRVSHIAPISRRHRLDRMAKLTDRDLVDRARTRGHHQGDAAAQEAFGQLVRRYQPRIYRLALHM